MVVPFPKPRYEVRQARPSLWIAHDTAIDKPVVYSGSSSQRDAQATVDILNREYQRWLTDRFYDRMETQNG